MARTKRDDIVYPCRRFYRPHGALIEFTSYSSKCQILKIDDEHVKLYPVGSYQGWAGPDHHAYEEVLSKRAELHKNVGVYRGK